MNEKRILIIDSDPLAQELLRELLDGDHRVLQAVSHAEALVELTSAVPIRAIILGINDRSNNSEFLRTLRNYAPNTPLVIHSGFPGAESNLSFPEFLQPYRVVRKGDAPNRLQEALASMLDDDQDGE